MLHKNGINSFFIYSIVFILEIQHKNSTLNTLKTKMKTNLHKEYHLSRGSETQRHRRESNPVPRNQECHHQSLLLFCYEVKSKTWRNNQWLFPQEKKNPKPAALQHSWMAHLHQPETRQKTADFPKPHIISSNSHNGTDSSYDKVRF